MKTVKVNTGRPYDIHIGSGVAGSMGALLRQSGIGGTLAIITDSEVDAIYGGPAAKALESSGFRVLRYAFPPGEGSKNMGTVSKILEFLASGDMTRSDCIVALGGGIPGDVAGFCASVYQRGIRFVQVPTTLLAAVDSSVGGKTGVNLEAGKNLAGAFWQPSAVFCDTDFLKTLPAGVFADGMAEVIKYGLLEAPEILDPGPNSRSPEDIIEKCVRIKAKYVEADERDTGERQKLNLGHTFGHAIEKASEFEVSHGRAVAIGMVIAAKVSSLLSIEKEPCLPALTSALESACLPVGTDIPADVLADIILKDKKRDGGLITLVLPVCPGECVLRQVPVGDLPMLLGAVLERA